MSKSNRKQISFIDILNYFYNEQNKSPYILDYVTRIYAGSDWQVSSVNLSPSCRNQLLNEIIIVHTDGTVTYSNYNTRFFFL